MGSIINGAAGWFYLMIMEDIPKIMDFIRTGKSGTK